MNSESSVDERATYQQERGSEMTAASTLTTLVSRSGDVGEQGEEDDKTFFIPQRFTKSGRKRAVPFPLKLMKVLSSREYSEIIAWMPSGMSFNILKPKAFVAGVLPDEFKSAKYSSFTRKLHRWGFMRHYRGEEAGAFYHKDFQRDRLDLIEKMTCHKVDSPKSHQSIPEKTTLPKDRSEAATQQTPGSTASKIAASPPAPTTSQVQQINAAERLNAAIELEVNRRLEERITAAALSRQVQTLALLQTPQVTSQVTPAIQCLQWGSPADQLSVLMIQKQADALKKISRFNTLFAGYRAVASDGQPLKSAPPTNVLGARTA